MAKKEVEFEEDLEIQEATSGRKLTGWMVAACAFAVLAIGAIGYIVVDKVNGYKAGHIGANSGDEISNEYDARIDAILDDARVVLEKYVSEPSEIKRDLEARTLLEIRDGLITEADKSKNVILPDTYWKNKNLYEEIEKRSDKLQKEVEEALAKHGLEVDDSLKISGFYYTKSYRSADGMVCQYADGSNSDFVAVNCAHESWVLGGKKELVSGLYDAFVAKRGDPIGDDDVYISAIKGDIIDGKTEGYQYIKAGVGLSYGYFYRKIGDKWQYVDSERGLYKCEDYTGDAAKAFAGKKCYLGNGDEKTIGE